MEGWVVFRTYRYPNEADAVRGILEANGIESVVNADDCGGVDPALGLVRGVGLLVRADQVKLAATILEEAQHPRTSDAESDDAK